MGQTNPLARIPAWVGFLLLILAGVALIINGAVAKPVSSGGILLGAFAIAIGVFSWVVGGVSRVKGRVGDIGVLVEIGDLPWWAWLIDAVLVVGAFIGLMVIRAG
jgi:hypothetical protein